MQVSYSILSKISIPDIKRRDKGVLSATDISTGTVEGSCRDPGIERSGGSYSHVGIDGAEVFIIWGGGLPEGEVVDRVVCEI